MDSTSRPDDDPEEIVPCLEEFLKEAGWGLYSKFILGIICFVHFAQGITFAAIPWALALSTCDLVFIPTKIALNIFTSFYFGFFIGAVIVGIILDRYGRKRYLSYSLIFVFMSTFFAAFSYSALILVGAALFLGIGLELNHAILTVLLAEILPQERRGFYLAMCSWFWTIGFFVTSGFTILFETRTFLDYEKPDPRLAPWRVMFVSCGGINIFIACACALLEESPRHYIYLGKSYLGFLILKQLYAINTSMHADSFKVKEADIKKCIKPYNFAYREPVSTIGIWRKLLWRLREALKMIFSKRFRHLTLVLSLIKIPATVASAFHLNVAFAKYPALPSKTSDKLQSLDFVYPVLINHRMDRVNFTEDLSTCGNSTQNIYFHRQFLILAVSVVIGGLWTMGTIERLGRRWLICASLLLASFSSISLAFVGETYYFYTILASLLIMASVVLWITTSIVTIESYPTAIRGTAIAVTTITGLLAQTIFINVIYVDRKIYSIIFGVIYFCLSFLSCVIEDLSGKPMAE